MSEDFDLIPEEPIKSGLAKRSYSTIMAYIETLLNEVELSLGG